MSRRAKDYTRKFEPDAIYNSVKVTRFINRLMLDGKRSVAERIVYKALEALSKEVNEQPMEAFDKVLRNVMPLMEVRSRRVGGSTYQVPMEVRAERSLSLAMRWIVNKTRERSGRSSVDKLTREFIDAYNNTGGSVKKREDTHKMAEANKAFAHFRW